MYKLPVIFGNVNVFCLYNLEQIYKLVVAGGDNHQALINNLQPVTHYEIRMSAVNALGTGPHSTTVALATGEEGM